MLNKKAQLKIQEMAFMILAVFLFFILVGVFVLSIVYSGIYEEANRIKEDRTLSAVVSLADSPELACISAKSNCIDGDKLITLIDNNRYENFWPFSSLRVIKASGFGVDEENLVECNFANYPNCDIFNVYDRNVSNERAIASFVAFCRKEYENTYTYDKCEIAKIIAGTELKIGGEV
ncbi:hypothetical protein CMI38_00645 [Candidatus Pacearchaeota archaeon]|nr:hypothetical protein [Candidatus Pacearchaeota archaeon]|tara:strand:- start:3 stop:533 length:531 start_codon:yes stop_codon:yes gene_type:complete